MPTPENDLISRSAALKLVNESIEAIGDMDELVSLREQFIHFRDFLEVLPPVTVKKNGNKAAITRLVQAYCGQTGCAECAVQFECKNMRVDQLVEVLME